LSLQISIAKLEIVIGIKGITKLEIVDEITGIEKLEIVTEMTRKFIVS
jgi:hypothetical protein